MAAWRATLAALASYAIDFDSISEAEGARYPAVDFVEWVRLEVGGNDAFRGEERTGRPSESGPLRERRRIIHAGRAETVTRGPARGAGQ